eukprot:Tamp_25972.p3 GENE.Tamp_25972~~Tamp_25972.p3  ORF type:complete len:107 (-),score=1.05 Tamp_25972:284-604(-)
MCGRRGGRDGGGELKRDIMCVLSVRAWPNTVFQTLLLNCTPYHCVPFDSTAQITHTAQVHVLAPSVRVMSVSVSVSVSVSASVCVAHVTGGRGAVAEAICGSGGEA